MQGTPGLSPYLNMKADGGEVRGSWDMDGFLYTVCGSGVYRSKSGVKTTCTGALLTTSGHVWMKDNGIEVMIIDGSGYGYTVTGTTVTQVTDVDFPVAQGLAYQDGYFMTVEKETGRWSISGLRDGTTWAALEYVTAESEPDDAVCPISDHKEVTILGKDTMEAYRNTGNADFPFEVITAGHQEVGISAPHSPAQGDNTFFWLSTHRQVLRAAGIGGSPTVVSTKQLEKRFQAFSKVDDAFGFCIVMLGFTWYVLGFPSQNETWVYNATTDRWHQWASYPSFLNVVRHRSNCYVYHDGNHLVGDYENGWLYKVDPIVYTDDGQQIRSVHTFPPIQKKGDTIVHKRVQIKYKTGVGIVSGQGSDPQVMLQWSDDGMRTWSNQHWRSLGKIGEYKKPVFWNKLGRSESRIYRTIVTDPVERVFSGFYLNGEIK